MGIIGRKKAILLNEPHLETVQSGNTSDSAQIAAFRTDMATKLKSLKVYFSPVQSGSGDPSPDNVRPISGHTGLTAKQTGVNMLKCDMNSYNANGVKVTGYRNSDGEIAYYTCEGTVPTTKVNNLFMNINYIPNNLRWPPYYGNYATYAYSSKANVRLVATANSAADRTHHGSDIVEWLMYDNLQPSNSSAEWIIFQMIPYKCAGVNYDTVMQPIVCLQQDTGCDFEPYKGKDLQIDWSDIGTKYGGYVDLVSGELVVTHKKVTLDGSSDFTIQSSSLYVIWKNISDMPLSDFYNDPAVMCDKCVKVSARGNYSGNLQIRFGAGNNSIYLYYLNEYAGTTGLSSTVKEWLDANPITVTYPLATPQTYQLTPQTIKTLIGRNNIWSDAGDVEVKYWKH